MMTKVTGVVYAAKLKLPAKSLQDVLTSSRTEADGKRWRMYVHLAGLPLMDQEAVQDKNQLYNARQVQNAAARQMYVKCTM